MAMHLSSAASGSFRPQQNLPGLHGLRALAACAIVLLHTVRVPQPSLPVPFWLSSIVLNLRVGVTLFFILSAFSLLYSNTWIVGTRGWVAIYLIKRLFRIAPLFYAMMAFYCGLAAYYGVPIETMKVLASLLFVFGFVPEWHESIVWAGWTIGVEMPFYVCVPLILIGIRNRQCLDSRRRDRSD